MPDDKIELIPSMKLLESNRRVIGETREGREITPAIANLMGYISTLTTNLPTNTVCGIDHVWSDKCNFLPKYGQTFNSLHKIYMLPYPLPSSRVCQADSYFREEYYVLGQEFQQFFTQPLVWNV